MPKTTQGVRTPLQERMLAVLCLLDCTVGQGAYFRSEAINRILGGRWTTHRQKQLDALVKSGALLKKEYHRYFTESYYALTETTRMVLSVKYDVTGRDYVPADKVGQEGLL